MRTEFLKQFYKDLDKLSKSVKDDVANTIENVDAATRTTEIKNLKKLTGYKHAYRIKIGDYRIGVYIENGVVEFARVNHRKDIYKIFP
jgi:mRNA interferase RelE/StbE